MCSEVFPLCSLCAWVADPDQVNPDLDPTLGKIPDSIFKKTGSDSKIIPESVFKKIGSDLKKMNKISMLKGYMIVTEVLYHNFGQKIFHKIDLKYTLNWLFRSGFYQISGIWIHNPALCDDKIYICTDRKFR